MTLKLAEDRAILEIGDRIPLHMAAAGSPVMEVDTAAGNKFTGNTNFIVKRCTFQFNKHELVVELIMNMKGFPPGNAQFIRRFS